MKKLIILIPFFIFALDSDLDGVPDNLDICPNTPFLEIVNKQGCSKNQLKPKIKYNFYIGYEIDKYKNYKDSKSLFYSISAKKNNLKLSIYNSFFKTSKKYKLNDFITSIYFYKTFSKIYLKTGVKYYFSTEINKKEDYALYLQIDYANISISDQYKTYKEKYQKYKNTFSIYLNFWYKKFFISPYFYIENSSYNTSKKYKYIGNYLSYEINKKLSVAIDFSFQTNTIKNNSLITTINYNF